MYKERVDKREEVSKMFEKNLTGFMDDPYNAWDGFCFDGPYVLDNNN